MFVRGLANIRQAEGEAQSRLAVIDLTIDLAIPEALLVEMDVAFALHLPLHAFFTLAKGRPFVG